MNLITHFAADAASFSAFTPSGDRHFETPWHRAVTVIEDAAGNLIRSVEVFAHGGVDVRGEAEAPHPIGAAPDDQPKETTSAEKADAPADDMASQGFAAFSEHADAAAEPEGEVK